jgi:hypothetical protein
MNVKPILALAALGAGAVFVSDAIGFLLGAKQGTLSGRAIQVAGATAGIAGVMWLQGKAKKG